VYHTRPYPNTPIIYYVTIDYFNLKPVLRIGRATTSIPKQENT